MASTSVRSVLNKGWRYALHSGQFKNSLKFEEFVTQFTRSQSEVLLRMKAAPIASFDLDQIRGVSGARTLPAIAGSTGVGEIMEVGADCKKFAVGDRVVMASAVSGSWTSYQSVSEKDLVKVPSTIPLEYASVFVVGPLLAFQVLRQSGLEKGDTLVVNAANTVVGLCVMQLSKHFGYNCVGVMQCSSAEDELQMEKLKQMGLQVVADPIAEADSLFGSSKPKLFISLSGGYTTDFASLLESQGNMVTCGSTFSEPLLLNDAAFLEKNLSLKGFSIFEWLQTADIEEVETATAEIASLISANKLKMFLLRHELANAITAIEDASYGSHQVILMHEGTEKTWPNKSKDEYMKIDEKLQKNWDSAAAEQEPYLKSGRQQPWSLPEAISDPNVASQLSSEMKNRLAFVRTPEDVSNFLETLSQADKRLLGVPDIEPEMRVTPADLKKTIAALQANQ